MGRWGPKRVIFVKLIIITLKDVHFVGLICNTRIIMSVNYLSRDPLLVAFVSKDTPAEGDGSLDRSCWWPSRDEKLASRCSSLLTGTRRKGDRSKFIEGPHWSLMGVECLGYVRRSSWLLCLCSRLGSTASYMSYWLTDKRSSKDKSSFDISEWVEGEQKWIH